MSRRPYWCSKTMKQRPCWCSKSVLWELNSFQMQTLSFVPINLHRCWPREWKRSIRLIKFNSASVLQWFPLSTLMKSINYWPRVLVSFAVLQSDVSQVPERVAWTPGQASLKAFLLFSSFFLRFILLAIFAEVISPIYLASHPFKTPTSGAFLTPYSSVSNPLFQ